MDTPGSFGRTLDDAGGPSLVGAATAPRVRSRLVTGLGLAFGLVALFLFAHPYRGLWHDGLLYAMQGLRELYPEALDGDPFFRFGSQGSFTIFPAIYAAFIRHFGLEHAAWFLSRAGAALLVASALLLARRLTVGPLAWLCVALFVLIPGKYGAGGTFSSAEDFLTARPITEALGLLALASGLAGQWRRAAGLTALGLLLHPLIALPTAIYLVLLGAPRQRAALIAAGVLALLAATAVANVHPVGPLQLLDPEWRALVAKHTSYLLPETWQLLDWQRVIVPLATLAVAALVLRSSALRVNTAIALAIGGAGLGLTLYASYVSPVLLLIQGQPWRWMWLSKAVAVLLLAPLAVELWQRGRNGRAILALLVVAWMGAEDAFGLEASACAVAAALLAFRSPEPPRWLWVPAAALAAAFGFGVFWLWAPAWIPVAAGVIVLWWCLCCARNRWLPALAALVASGFCAQQVALALNAPAATDFDAAERAFRPWQAWIRPDQVVLFPGEGWKPALLLHRRSYLTAGPLIFSRAAALDADAAVHRVKDAVGDAASWWGKPPVGLATTQERDPPKPSLAALQRLCAIPKLDFVVAPVAFPVRHLPSDAVWPYQDLFLYDCRDLLRLPAHE